MKLFARFRGPRRPRMSSLHPQDLPPSDGAVGAATDEGCPYWPTGLARPLATTATLLPYFMGEGAVAVAGPCLDLVGTVLLVSVLTPHDQGMSRTSSCEWGNCPHGTWQR